MKSLISECIVFNWVIEKYREQNKYNPCALCPYATENCLDYLSRGYVPLTGEKIDDIKNMEEPQGEANDTITENKTTSTSPHTCNKKTLPKKKKKRKRR